MAIRAPALAPAETLLSHLARQVVTLRILATTPCRRIPAAVSPIHVSRKSIATRKGRIA